MTKTKILSNLPIEDLTSETDFLGIIDKGELIKTFLIGNKDQFNEIKLFSLYGEWGSGKSSLMKYLEKELKADFNTFFFEAWEFEKDENLAMSLLEFINSKNIDTGEQFSDDLLKYGGRILRGLGKSVKFNVPLYPKGPEIELDLSSFVEEVSKTEELTFYKARNLFKKEFIRFEDKITKGKNPKNNIIFIDDLDRCEPEQVLNLLSAIKLFFTYGEKTIFFCGIDKKAVEQAVKTKYGKIVKANEYLEKIFDVSFSMPEHEDFLKLVNQYFDNTIYTFGVNKLGINERITEFLIYLEFTNPRRVKKVLNKFQILRNLSEINLSKKFLPYPNIDKREGVQNSYLETILVLYLIILHEFYPEYFNDFLDFEKKRSNYSNALIEMGQKSDLFDFILNNCSKNSFEQYPRLILSTEKKSKRFINYFLICFGPNEINKFNISNFYENQSIMIDRKNKIEHLFLNYLSFRSLSIIKDENNLSKASLSSLKKLIKNVL